MSTFQFLTQSQQVDIKLLEQVIGAGVAKFETETVGVKGHYTWPPDAPAEVPMSFFLHLRADKTCTVQVNWPGILPTTIASEVATWFEFLILARPVINVQTPDGDLIVFSYTGPPGDPEKVTGFQISVSLNGAQHSAALTFMFPR